LEETTSENWVNQLYFGDNLKVLRESIPDESVDLIYLDPPFNSNATYNMLSEETGSEQSAAQITAFEDTWRWGKDTEIAYHTVIEESPKPLVELLQAIRAFLGTGDVLAYLTMMTPRLRELHRVLKTTGSLYLHCDPASSHYLKLLLDAIFEKGCFRNEVIWRYRRWPARSHQFQKMHDVLLFYSKSPSGEHHFNVLYGYEKLADSTLKTFGTQKQVADFSSGHRKPSTTENETPGPPLSDVWEIGIIAPIAKERRGYPTQKPEALLERILLASSNEGDVVLDPFCGCGTAMAVAEKLNRKWIGIDCAYVAVSFSRGRLHECSDRQNTPYRVIGIPDDLNDVVTEATAQFVTAGKRGKKTSPQPILI
jgi:site-specific DNA-methyltransferase (adenine-specific)